MHRGAFTGKCARSKVAPKCMEKKPVTGKKRACSRTPWQSVWLTRKRLPIGRCNSVQFGVCCVVRGWPFSGYFGRTYRFGTWYSDNRAWRTVCTFLYHDSLCTFLYHDWSRLFRVIQYVGNSSWIIINSHGKNMTDCIMTDQDSSELFSM